MGIYVFFFKSSLYLSLKQYNASPYDCHVLYCVNGSSKMLSVQTKGVVAQTALSEQLDVKTQQRALLSINTA